MMQKNKLNDSSAEKKLVGSFWKGKNPAKGSALGRSHDAKGDSKTYHDNINTLTPLQKNMSKTKEIP
jgi:hypothetical protein